VRINPSENLTLTPNLKMEKGVSVVVFAVMMVMVIFLVFSVWYAGFAQSSIKKAEIEHMRKVEEQFRYLQSLVSGLRENGDSCTAEFQFSPLPPVGVLYTGRASTFWAEKEFENLPGLIGLEIGNQICPRVTYIYEGGAVLVKQGTNVFMKYEPKAFFFENGSLIYQEVRLKDNLSKIVGSGRIALVFFVENLIEENLADKIYIWSRYPSAWKKYLYKIRDSMFPNASLEPLDNGWVLSLGTDSTYVHRILSLSFLAC